MYIISQNFINETKKLIISQLSVKIERLLNEILNSIFNDFYSNKSLIASLNLQKRINQLVCESILAVIRIIDNIFLKSIERKENLYVSKKNISRTLITIWGTINYTRHYYCDKNKENGFFFIDKLFGIEKYKNYDQLVRSILIEESVYTNANKVSLHNPLDNLNILSSNKLKTNMVCQTPKQTIYSWIKNLTLPKVKRDTIKADKTLYVMVDEKWIHEQASKKDITDEQKKKYIMSKCFVTFTGVKRKHGRTSLIGRHIFITSKTSAWKEFMDEICMIYDFESLETINLLSDAGQWILSGKDELKLYSHNKIVVNTCEFHVIQKIHRITTEENIRNNLIASIYDKKDKKEFCKIMDSIIEKKPKRKEKLTQYKNYIINHWKGILNMKSLPFGSSMESHISHCVAEHFGSRPKGFSKDNIETYLKLEQHKQNNINILDLIIKSISATEDFTYNEKEVDYSMFDKSTPLLPVRCSNNPISNLMHDIALSKNS